MDHTPIAVIGLVCDDEASRAFIFGAHHHGIAEAIFVGEIEVALIMGRSAVNGAGAVIHQNEIRDIDRQIPVRIERVDGADAGVKTELFRLVDHLLGGAGALALGNEGREIGIFCRRGRRQRMVGRQRQEFDAENGILARRENLDLGFTIRERSPDRA